MKGIVPHQQAVKKVSIGMAHMRIEAEDDRSIECKELVDKSGSEDDDESDLLAYISFNMIDRDRKMDQNWILL